MGERRDKQTERRARDDAMTDAEFLAEYERKYGRTAAEKIAKALAMDPPPRKPRRVGPNASTRVGAKPKPRPAVPRRRGGVSWAERRQMVKAEGLPPETVRERHLRGTHECAWCHEPIVEGEPACKLFPSTRIVHGRCARDAAHERCAK